MTDIDCQEDVVKISCTKGAPPSMKTRYTKTREEIPAKGREQV